MTRLLFISTKNRWFFRLTLLTTGLAFAYIMLGAYSRLLGLSLACPDWPLCFGHLFMPHIDDTVNFYPVRIEMALRYLLFVMAGAVILLTCLSYRLQRQLGMQPFMLCVPLLAAVMLEMFFAKLTATQTLHPSIMLMHLLLQFSLLGLLWWVGRISRPNSYSFTHPSLRQLRPWAWLAFLFLVLQIMFGGWVNATANDICAHFPYCNIQLTPKVNWNHVINPIMETTPAALAHLHTLHRLGALLGFFYLGLFGFMLVFNRYIYHLGFTICILLGAQFTAGVLHVEWLQTPGAIISQLVLMALLLLAVISLLTNLYNKPQDYLYG